jgi:hypothetical protein
VEVALDDLKVVAVLTGVPEPSALVRLPDGDQFLVRRSSCLGTARAPVRSFENDRVVVGDDGAERSLRIAARPAKD